MASFTITGGTPLYGSVRLGGAKNASFKLIIASLLAKSESRFLNLSNISEVEHAAACIQALGGQIRRRGERTIFINPAKLTQSSLPAVFGVTSRQAPMFIPVLLHRFHQATVPAPGGDKLGARPIDWHLEALTKMGAKIRYSQNTLQARCQTLKGIRYRFPKNSHTGTETVIMAAALASGETLIENAAQEPEVDDLIVFLNQCGARIRRRHNRTIEIIGVPQLTGTIHQVMPDRNEAVSYACAALMTHGDIIVENAQSQYLTAFLEKLDEIKGGYEIGNYGIRFYYHQPLRAADVTTEPHPGFMTDWQPLWAVLATQLQGASIIHETVYPSRFQYLAHLQAMGAQIELFSPPVSHPDKFYNFHYQESKPPHQHAIRIFGPSPLTAGHFTCHDLRHGATLVLAALTAQGTSTIQAVEQIDRGYEDLDGRLKSLGAQIDRRL